MHTIEMDQERFFLALGGDCRDSTWYVDKNSGHLLRIDPAPRGARLEHESHPERYVLVEPIRCAELYPVLRDFLTDVKDGSAREFLWECLQSNEPCTSFTDTLFCLQDVRSSWFRHRVSFFEKKAEEFFRRHRFSVISLTKRPSSRCRIPSPNRRSVIRHGAGGNERCMGLQIAVTLWCTRCRDIGRWRARPVHGACDTAIL